MGVASSIRSYVRSLEDWWFDATRGVQTSGTEAKTRDEIVGERSDSKIYGAVRATNARAAIRDLPIKNFSEYTFVDMGSGKGRMLFIAAEFPFRRVVGVEFSKTLHEEALANLAHYRHGSRRCDAIESVHANAMEFEFPEENLVVYMFNPFGPEVMARMLENLGRSLERAPRHVVVVMLWPEHGDVLTRFEWLREYRNTRRHLIYQAN